MTRLRVLVMFLALLGIAAFAYGAQVVMVSGRPMMPLHAFVRTFGGVVNYDSVGDGFSISLGCHAVDFVPFSRTAWVDNYEVGLATPVVIIDDITYVPVDFLCRSCDLECTWSNADQQVIVVNNLTRTRFVLMVDLAWESRPHVWRHAAGYVTPSWHSRARQYQAGYQTPIHARSGSHAPYANTGYQNNWRARSYGSYYAGNRNTSYRHGGNGSHWMSHNRQHGNSRHGRHGE